MIVLEDSEQTPHIWLAILAFSDHFLIVLEDSDSEQTRRVRKCGIVTRQGRTNARNLMHSHVHGSHQVLALASVALSLRECEHNGPDPADELDKRCKPDSSGRGKLNGGSKKETRSGNGSSAGVGLRAERLMVVAAPLQVCV